MRHKQTEQSQNLTNMKKVMKAVAALMLMTAVVFAAGCKKQEPSSGSFNGHEYVDLGLPSGTMWATSNVEAGNAKGYAYFAWGETSTKTTYNWATYKWSDGNDSPKLTKYCYDPRYGFEDFTDDLTVLKAEDDAATVHWGDGWRTPTKEDWQELVNNCTYEWTTRNGMNGGLFTASNGNTLFLPAAGKYDKPSAGGLIHYGDYGEYWSSSLYMNDGPDYAFSVQINKVSANSIDPMPRLVGFTIRPVHSAN